MQFARSDDKMASYCECYFLNCKKIMLMPAWVQSPPLMPAWVQSPPLMPAWVQPPPLMPAWVQPPLRYDTNFKCIRPPHFVGQIDGIHLEIPFQWTNMVILLNPSRFCIYKKQKALVEGCCVIVELKLRV